MSAELTPGQWNSLEITKLVVSALGPICAGALAFVVAKYTKTLESSRWRNEKLIETRLEFYKDVVPKLNNLYCFLHAGRQVEGAERIRGCRA